jgi:hypothetical protein
VQSNTGPTSAQVNASTNAAGTSTYAATAVGNDVEASTTNSPVTLSVTQSQTGAATTGQVAVSQNASGDYAAAATATGNNANIVADSYATLVNSAQDNEGAVNASATSTVGQWSGTAANAAYGVGNSVLVANAGSYTGVNNDQNNTGAITISSSFSSAPGGGAGGDVTVSASGVGNAATAYACGSCNGTLSIKNKQVNSGAVRSTASTNTYGVTSVTGSSTAIGNTATFQVEGGSD